MTKKHSEQYVSEELNSMGFKLISSYVGTNIKVDIEDGEGYRYNVSFDSLRGDIEKGYFPEKFSSSNKYSIPNICVWLSENELPIKYVRGRYVSAVKRNIVFKCLLSKLEWKSSWNEVNQRKRCQCETCKSVRATNRGRLKHLSYENNFEFLSPSESLEWDYSKNIGSPKDYCPSSDYKAFWICSVCGNKWSAQIKNRSLGNGCPVCKSSWGEKRIYKYLSENSFMFEDEYVIEECRNIRPLPFDFGVFIDSKLVLIEYNGALHYKSIDFFGGERRLKYIQNNDRIKKEYCKKNKIKLIIIPYKDFDSIEKILDKKL